MESLHSAKSAARSVYRIIVLNSEVWILVFGNMEIAKDLLICPVVPFNGIRNKVIHIIIIYIIHFKDHEKMHVIINYFHNKIYLTFLYSQTQYLSRLQPVNLTFEQWKGIM